jgi:pimeloyl-ACP methyl ester carboxylesterase
VSAAWETSLVQAGEVRLNVRRQTAPGKPLLLLHGLGASGAVWQAFARRLSPPWQCITLDLRGHGDSDKPAAGYDPADYARDMAALIEELRTGPVPVIGHSLGALAAIRLAADQAKSVRAVVLLDPPLDPAIEGTDVAEVYRLRNEPPGELERQLSVPALAPIFRQAADAPFETYLNTPRGARWAWDAASRVGAPVLMIQADPAQGGVLGDEIARDFAAMLTHGEHVKIDGAGHAVHATHGARVAELVKDFLEQSVV